ncbi:hypothetical protein [Piscinibacter sakaiensis]|uniref:hypothetical protein n=1 Tax=Piscinibacter sakaiensis TaxID=1547922 RepID=UPI003AABA345
MATTTSSLTKYSVRPSGMEAQQTTISDPTVPDQFAAPSKVKGGRGTGRRVGVAVRLGHEDWARLHDLAVRERTSLQGLIVAGLSNLMEQRGLPPLSGR